MVAWSSKGTGNTDLRCERMFRKEFRRIQPAGPRVRHQNEEIQVGTACGWLARVGGGSLVRKGPK